MRWFSVVDALELGAHIVVASCSGILTLGNDDVTPLNSAEPLPGAPIACLGAGTGLGECFLTPGPGGSYVCWPSEGGHAEWAPRVNGR